MSTPEADNLGGLRPNGAPGDQRQVGGSATRVDAVELVAPGRHTLLSSAAAWYQAGACVLPVAIDGSKRPGLPAWKGYQAERPSERTLVGWMQAAEGIGLVTGEVSGRLEMLELEGRAVVLGLEDDLAALVEARAPGLWAKATTYSERTPSGGLHLLYRLDGPVPSNTALAHMPDPEDRKRSLVLIETRGEGGFVVVAPSNGRTHRSGGAWTVQQGEPGQVPTLTADEHAVLHECARALDRMPPKPEPNEPPERPQAAADELRPGEDYNPPRPVLGGAAGSRGLANRLPTGRGHALGSAG